LEPYVPISPGFSAARRLCHCSSDRHCRQRAINLERCFAGGVRVGHRAEQYPHTGQTDFAEDSAIKRDTQSNVESVRRNLQSALPDMISALSNAPEDLAASFKLYRNMDALFDVFGQVVESAGAFGSKDEFQNLSNDMSSLQSARRMLGERMQSLAAAKEAELIRLRNQIKLAQAAPPAPAKKVVVDDTEPPKKPVKRKVPKAPAPAPAPAPAATPK